MDLAEMSSQVSFSSEPGLVNLTNTDIFANHLKDHICNKPFIVVLNTKQMWKAVKIEVALLIRKQAQH